MAQIEIPIGADVIWILEQAGHPTGIDSKASVEGTTLTCPDCTQEELDIALSSYNHQTYILSDDNRKDIRQINKKAAAEILALAPIYQQINELTDAITVIIEKLDLIGDPRLSNARILRDRVRAIRNNAKAEKDKINAR
jgi:hypothetical protein